MERRIKRPSDDTVYNYNNNKKSKFLVTTTKSYFENLPNETFYEIFEYLEYNDIYHGFFYLNKRFQNLLINLNIPFQINLSTISKLQFDLYNKNVFQPNKHQIKILRLSNPFTIDMIFSSPRLICNLIRIEKLIFDHINSKYFNNILKYLMHLPKLHSLILSPIDYIQNPTIIFNQIFRLKKLKYCKLTYKIKDNENILPIDFDQYEQSSIEYLIINSPFRYESFQKLFIYLPKLRHLSINYLLGSNNSQINFYPIELKDLKYVSFDLHSINFRQFKKLIKNFFHHIEVLRISTFDDFSYSHAEQWEELISSSIPNLHIFDMKNSYTTAMDGFLYLCLSGHFRSKFWKEKQWFFDHQYDCHESSNNGTFYSTNPYRRKDHTFHWQYNHCIDSNVKKHDFKSVKHINICGKRAINNYVIYFSNATELTIKNYGKTYYGSMLTVLNQILPLKQLKKLIIDCNDFPIQQVLNLISLTPNLRLLKWNFQSIDQTKLKLIEQSETFRSLSNTNKIQNLQILHCCLFDEIQFFIKLFPQLESLQIAVFRKQIIQIIRCLLSKMDHLFFLHITDIIKTYLQKLNFLIKSENLLNDYLIKFIDHDLYLWW
ncbi:unnamed protein product [Rotaria sordida]|uniref:F-box domain-containing protein n=2 Tax=Rotaria sordida TaxID=392033 RepID=A0A814GP37_9BILA|nr:unnamed protein product [Rotaria sordida]